MPRPQVLLTFTAKLVLSAALLLSTAISQAKDYQLNTVAGDLNFPWSIAFLPDGDYLLAMRAGELRRVSASGEVGPALANTPTSYVAGQGGYFDVVLDPDFGSNQTVYLAFAHGSGSANATRVVSARLEAESLADVTPIFTVQPTKDTAAHYGGRLQFLNDGTLTLTTGDGFEYREAAQDPFSQLGKIVRMNKDGSPAAGNPFADGKAGDPWVWSLGHRSPQGLAYDAASNTLYMHEHGPQGGDEVNVVVAGANYGWPVTGYGVNYSGARVSPFQQRPGITDPIKYWTPSIAPSGLTYYSGDAFPAWQGDLLVGALVDREVRHLDLENGKVIAENTLFDELDQRIREVRQGPDGLLYLLTDSDKGELIRVSPSR